MTSKHPPVSTGIPTVCTFTLFPQRIRRDTKGVHVSFTLRNNLLISIREDDIGLVRLLRHYMRQIGWRWRTPSTSC